MTTIVCTKHGVAFGKSAAALIVLSAMTLTGCVTKDLPQIRYDDEVPPLPAPPALAADTSPEPLHTPPAWTAAKGGVAADTPTAQVANANAAARIEPRRAGYYNALQVYPWSEGALYQLYAVPGQISDIALEPGENLSGPGPIAAGDTARWIIGDTMSGSGSTARTHVLVKPTRPDISTNLVITTDRRRYMIELRSGARPYMPAIAWAYPESSAKQRSAVHAAPSIPARRARNYRYGLQLQGDNPPWRPISVFDDGRHVYVVFPSGIAQGEMPPLFVLGPDGAAQIVNSRVTKNVLITDRLFAAAELRLGSGERQQVVRILRIDDRKQASRAGSTGESS